jgi:hypothetical protein
VNKDVTKRLRSWRIFLVTDLIDLYVQYTAVTLIVELDLEVTGIMKHALPCHSFFNGSDPWKPETLIPAEEIGSKKKHGRVNHPKREIEPIQGSKVLCMQ